MPEKPALAEPELDAAPVPAASTVKARWVAGYEAILPDGTILEPGVTVVELPADEARASDNWKVT